MIYQSLTKNLQTSLGSDRHFLVSLEIFVQNSVRQTAFQGGGKENALIGQETFISTSV